MARAVFFSFHYQRDIHRVQVVKQHHMTKGTYTAAGFFDGSLEEKSKREGDGAVKALIDRGLNGASVTCVLMGAETYQRRWVDYEVLKSVELGMGVFGIRIHNIPDMTKSSSTSQGKDSPGSNVFEFLGYRYNSQKFQPVINYSGEWTDAPYQSEISSPKALYLKNQSSAVNLSSIFRIYDWASDNGYANFPQWVEAAAKQAGR